MAVCCCGKEEGDGEDRVGQSAATAVELATRLWLHRTRHRVIVQVLQSE